MKHATKSSKALFTVVYWQRGIYKLNDSPWSRYGEQHLGAKNCHVLIRSRSLQCKQNYVNAKRQHPTKAMSLTWLRKPTASLKNEECEACAGGQTTHWCLLLFRFRPARPDSGDGKRRCTCHDGQAQVLQSRADSRAHNRPVSRTRENKHGTRPNTRCRHDD